jgi:hypothetical protein
MVAVEIVFVGGFVRTVETLLVKIKVNSDRLQEFSLPQLRQLWRHCLPKQPIPDLKCLIWQGLAWHLQSDQQPLPITTQKLLLAAMRASSYPSAKSDTSAFVPVVKLAPMPEGTRLVRKWRGRLFEVFIGNGGADFHFNGKIYKSLSHIAKEITGAHWSGPRFFGLTNKLKESAYV